MDGRDPLIREIRLLGIPLIILATVAVGFVFYQLRSILIPFVIAIFLSYLFKPLVASLSQRRGIPMPITIAIVLIAVAAIVTLFALGVYSTVDAFVAALPRYQQRIDFLIQSFWETIQRSQLRDLVADISWQELIDISALSTVLTSSLGSIFAFLTNFFLVLFFMMFILAGTGDVGKKLRKAFYPQYAERLEHIVRNIDHQVRQYIFTKTLISLATGSVATLILAFFGVDFALLWGVLTFLLNYIPNFGSIVATLLPSLFSLIQFGDLGLALLLGGILTGMQMVIGNVIEPKIMGESLDLSPLLVLVALIFWGWLWGLIGMVLSVPMIATLKIICENVPPLKPLAVLMGGIPASPSASKPASVTTGSPGNG